MEELEGMAQLLDPDALASARSKRKHALDTKYTPDGLKVRLAGFSHVFFSVHVQVSPA